MSGDRVLIVLNEGEESQKLILSERKNILETLLKSGNLRIYELKDDSKNTSNSGPSLLKESTTLEKDSTEKEVEKVVDISFEVPD